MRFEEACNNYPGIMLLIDPRTGGILEANKRATDIYEYSLEELKNMTIMDINVLKKEQIKEEMELAREERRSYFHFPHRTKSGNIIEMEVESYPTKSEGQDALFSLIRPCEERSYFNSVAMRIVQESRDLVIVVDQNCRIIKVNKKFAEIFKCNEVKAIGNRICECLKVKNNLEYDSIETKLIAGEVVEMNIEIDNLIDKYRFSNLIGIPTYFRDKFFGAVISVRDRSTDAAEEIEKSKKLERALNDAEKYRKDKDDFYARMSHDMRTPLNAVISYSDFGIEESGQDISIKYFRQIKNSSKYLLGLLDDLLNFNKVENGHISLNEEPVMNNDIIDNVCSVIKARAELKEVELEVNLDEKIWQCQMFDELRIKQIYLNVLSNAVKYSKPSSKIIWNQEYLYDECGKPYFRNEIIDFGVGITDNFKKIMYNPYSREENELSSCEESSGLGLAIVKNLLDSLGGSIDCESKVGSGTKMIIEIPAKELNKNNCIEKYNDINKLSYEGNKVLVIEDNIINYNIANKLLKAVDIKTENAVDGIDGIDKFRSNEYNAILMDIRMPNMDGIEATRKIREFDDRTPIIGFSANASKEDAENSLRNGMDAHLKKPVDKDALYRVLGELLNNGRKKVL